MNIIFDIGANNGSSTEVERLNTNNLIYAFEPTPELISKLLDISTKYLNYIVIPKAVSDFNGSATFNIAGQADWGCSSLLKFSENLNNTWPGRSDFKVTHTVEVEVIRLDKFIEENNISTIDYFHCDTQGSDVDVLNGLGKFYNIIKEGVIEVPASDQVKLYKNQHSKEQATAWLERHGYVIKSEKYQQNEYNIYFTNINHV